MNNSNESISSLWKKEYDQRGIPSSYRERPSTTVSGFFGNFFKTLGHKPGNAVDLGSGKGRNSFYLAELGFSVTAIDIVPENIEATARRAQEQGLAVTAICQDVTDHLPFEDNSQDLVIDIFCYKHQTNDEKRKFYRNEVQRILKPEGFYLISLAGNKDGYYSGLIDPQVSNNKIIDTYTGVGSVLFSRLDVESEFSDFVVLKHKTTTKPGEMHGNTYVRETHAFIMKNKP